MFLARAGKKAWCLKMLPTFRSSAQSEVLINPLQLPHVASATRYPYTKEYIEEQYEAGKMQLCCLDALETP